jgi:hypothetical protein
VTAGHGDSGDDLIRQRVQAAPGHADTDTATDAGTQRAQMLAHGRTWPDATGHTTRPLTIIRAGQGP